MNTDSNLDAIGGLATVTTAGELEAGEGLGLASANPAADQVPLPLDIRLLHSIRQLIRGMDLHSRWLAYMHKITAPQLGCLSFLNQCGRASIGQLARGICMSPSTVIGVVDRLEAKGLVARARDSKDRRLVHVSLTGAGSELMKNAPSPLKQSFLNAFNRLGPQRQQDLVDAIETVAGLMAQPDEALPDESAAGPDLQPSTQPSPPSL